MTEVAGKYYYDGSRRTIPVLRALAASPAGLSTPDLARQCAPDVKPWDNALTNIGNLLRRQETAGRVRLAGKAPGSYRRSAFLWQITAEGEGFLGCAARQRFERRGEGSPPGARSEIAEQYRATAAQCRVLARRIVLMRRRVAVLADLEASLTELELVEHEMEAFDGGELAPSQPLS